MKNIIKNITDFIVELFKNKKTRLIVICVALALVVLITATTILVNVVNHRYEVISEVKEDILVTNMCTDTYIKTIKLLSLINV